MSTIKLMCPKTNEVVFTGKATVDVKLSYIVAEDGTISTEIVSVDPVVESTEIKNVSSSKGKIKIDTLVQSMQSEVSGNWANIESLVQAEIEDPENPGQTKAVIMTQAEYDAMSAPASIDDMNEEQAKEFAKTQQAQLEQQAEQIAQLQAQMQQLLAAQQAHQVQPASKPVQAAPAPAKPATQQAPAPAVDTNIQMPQQTPAPQSGEVIYAEDQQQGDFGGFDQGNESLGQFDVEAPF